MKNSIKNVKKNPLISEEIRGFFENHGIDADSIFESIDFNSDPVKITEQIYEHEIGQKIILFSLLLEMRKQIQLLKEHIAIIEKKLD